MPTKSAQGLFYKYREKLEVSESGAGKLKSATGTSAARKFHASPLRAEVHLLLDMYEKLEMSGNEQLGEENNRRFYPSVVNKKKLHSAGMGKC